MHDFSALPHQSSVLISYDPYWVSCAVAAEAFRNVGGTQAACNAKVEDGDTFSLLDGDYAGRCGWEHGQSIVGRDNRVGASTFPPVGLHRRNSQRILPPPRHRPLQSPNNNRLDRRNSKSAGSAWIFVTGS